MKNTKDIFSTVWFTQQ